MKKCAYCGRENTDDAAHCRECGTAVATGSSASQALQLDASDQTLDIHGTINSYTKVGWKVGLAVAFVGLGIVLWLPVDYIVRFYAIISFIIAAMLPYLPYNKHTYLDFTDRQIVTLERLSLD